MRNDPDPYLVQQVATASKAMLTSMLFNAAVANTQRAIVHLDEARPQPARRFLIKAQEIVLELRTSLDHEAGGEIAAMALLDSVARLQPGVLNDAGSHQEDSFNPALDGLLDCPHYTRPEEWNGLGVPQELLSGHHARIAAWRREQRLAITARHRPDLIAAARRAGHLTRADEDFLAGL